MPSKELEKARAYEAAQGKQIPPRERPAFHMSPMVGWANDPNGFCYYKGEYHLFYQYHPYSTFWGPMHWGHATSKDLLHWQHLPAALAPDTPQDEKGCFSGSAVELPDGRLMLLYTGVQPGDTPDTVFQNQCVAFGDGVEFEKCPHNPVISAAQLPEGSSVYDFRDPKVWREEDGTLFCVVAGCNAQKDGRIFLFRSEDGMKWDYCTMLAASHGEYGRMWECPDFFVLDGAQVLLVNPQEVKPALGSALHPGDNALALIGSYDKQSYTFTRQQVSPVDGGLNFYAPQTTGAPDGRRIMVGWMDNWATAQSTPHPRLWYGQMTLPRELHIKAGQLYQQPVRELEQYRQNEVRAENIILKGEQTLPGVAGRILDMTVALDVKNSPDCRAFTIWLAQDETHATELTYLPLHQSFTLDRRFSGTSCDTAHTRQIHIAPKNGIFSLRVIMDQYSVEVFLNGGEQALTALIDTPPTAENISFSTIGAASFSVTKYDLAL